MVTTLADLERYSGMLHGLHPLIAVEEMRLVLMRQALFNFLDRHDVAIAHDQIDIVQR